MASHAAFKGLSFTGTGAHKWSVEFDNRKAYVKSENQLKEKQLAKAGARLAELLNAIWPEPVASRDFGGRRSAVETAAHRTKISPTQARQDQPYIKSDGGGPAAVTNAVNM